MKLIASCVRRGAPVRLCSSALAVLAAFPVLAQSQAQGTLDEVVVTATRVAQPLSDLVADVTVVDRDQIERSGATGVADLLARLPGLEMGRSGGIGGTTSVFLRGGNTQHTAVYLDGVRLDAQSGSGGVAWESIPLAQIDRIEVLRGPAGAVYGSDAINGVIQLFTRKGEGPATPYVGMGVGSHGLRKLEAGVSGATGDIDYSVGMAHETSDGFNVQPSRLRKPADGLRNPDQDGYDSIAANAKLGFQLSRSQRLEATFLASDLDSQYDANPRTPRNDLSLHHLRTMGLNWKASWTEVFSTTLSLTESQERYETTPAAYLTNTKLRGYLLQNEWRVGPHLMTAVLERREDQLENSSVGNTRNRSQDGVALGYGFSQAGHSLQLNLRHDDDSGFGGKSTGSAAYGYALTPKLRATASAGTAFRAPTLYQRFSDSGVSGLQPETSRNVEAGLHYVDGASRLSMVVYQNEVSNLINYVNGAGACVSPYGCYASVARAKYEGVTLSGTYALKGVNLRASVDFQDPRDLDTGKDLARRARHHLSLGADTQWTGWRLGAELQASGKRFDDTANTAVLGGYTVINLSASTPVGRDLTLLARLDNLADKDYQTARNYATDGRTLYVGLKWAPM
ncbi:TonB-dependent receptor domain-containing protein [Rhodoferax sp. BLA1]|uniref:TonB-dependent receptor domain-containing protein n=1 Tax=Rhodoferax sp. BLA1 TaxID=2576062 RepID=UPI0015D14908|nr:TonB-dependent receptor [Rhodoferax sp. BLA1]